jgi:exodeoxyribonuclease VII small subunit
MSDSPRSFEQALAELEQIVRDLEDGKLELEQALSKYETGVGLIRHCQGVLQQAEQRIRVLSGIDEAEKPITRPYEANPLAQEQPTTPADAVRRAPRRTPDEGGDAHRQQLF